jgi:hypothetical protein
MGTRGAVRVFPLAFARASERAPLFEFFLPFAVAGVAAGGVEIEAALVKVHDGGNFKF